MRIAAAMAAAFLASCGATQAGKAYFPETPTRDAAWTARSRIGRSESWRIDGAKIETQRDHLGEARIVPADGDASVLVVRGYSGTPAAPEITLRIADAANTILYHRIVGAGSVRAERVEGEVAVEGARRVRLRRLRTLFVPDLLIPEYGVPDDDVESASRP